MFFIPGVTAEALWEAVIFEKRARFEHRPRDLVKLRGQSKAHHSHGETALLDRPHRTPVVAIRIVSRVIGRERANSPAAEHVVL